MWLLRNKKSFKSIGIKHIERHRKGMAVMIEKRHIVLAAMVLALGTAVYINWQFADDSLRIDANTSQPSGTLGEIQYVNGSLVQGNTTSSGVDQTTNGDTLLPNVSGSQSADSYFVQAQLARQNARDKALDIIEETLEDGKDVDQKTLQALVEQAADLVARIEQETKIESLLKAKGYSENLAYISNGTANIIVKSKGLLPNETITIKDIVKNQSGISFENIIIVEVK